ncbi:MAG TPA: GNAT family N-acetyltransferase [Actinophytocola sp.]|uniref:GNAT family N-acetyltransferase n=1 Tax=Actinophytocola sp. TaxID=1872138 RepID=UPI002DBA47D0|nr:GNAT family N-acetyltransferase [Actinophytocola sp.]HEU5470470.1 GNAT family N-acetyltransferase [Actinophytocola sp.]
MLGTDRLLLTPVGPRDHTILRVHWGDPDVYRFLFDGAAPSDAEISGVIEDSERTFGAHGYGVWLVRERDGDRPVGTVALRTLADLGLEVVYSLAPSVWGRGYATEAAGAVVEHALGPLGLTEVLAEVDTANAASAAVVRRLGMVAFAVVPGVLGPMTRYRGVRDEQR